MKKLVSVVLIAMLMMCVAAPAEARRCGRRSTETYIEDPRMEAGLGIDLIYNVNDTFAVMSENRLDLNNNSISGNMGDWEHDGFSTYLVGVITLDGLFKK